MIETNPERKAMSAELWFGVLSLHVFVADRGVSPAEGRLRSSGRAGRRPKGPLYLTATCLGCSSSRPEGSLATLRSHLLGLQAHAHAVDAALGRFQDLEAQTLLFENFSGLRNVAG
jgi:hypothetical protein